MYAASVTRKRIIQQMQEGFHCTIMNSQICFRSGSSKVHKLMVTDPGYRVQEIAFDTGLVLPLLASRQFFSAMLQSLDFF